MLLLLPLTVLLLTHLTVLLLLPSQISSFSSQLLVSHQLLIIWKYHLDPRIPLCHPGALRILN